MITLLKRGMYCSFQETEPQRHLNGRKLYEIRANVLGGATSINGIQYARGTRRDYDGWASLGNEGWSYADVLPYFIRMETYSRGAGPHHGGTGPFHVSHAELSDPIAQAWVAAAVEAGFSYNDDLNGALPTGFGPPDEAVHAGRRVSAASAFLKPALTRENLTVVTQATVHKLILSGQRCTGLEYAHAGECHRVEAGTVILSAGVFGSPQLLMLSGIGNAGTLREHGIATRVDLPGVGRGLRDHPGFQISCTCPEPITDFRYMGPIRGAQAALNYLLFRRGFLARSAVRAVGLVSSSENEPDWPDLKIQFVNVLIDDGPDLRVTRHGYLVRISMTRPQSSGEVTLRSADPAAPPRINVNYLADQQDLQRARSGVRIAREIFRQPAMRRFRGDEVAPGAANASDEQIEAWLRSSVGSDAHSVGTCRMGHDENAVVDPRLQVHGVEGLRVIDASVMPTHIGGNTAAPTMMIAEKGADLILQGS
jgi:choline dehydrogenase